MESLELLRVAVIEDEVGVQGGSLGKTHSIKCDDPSALEVHGVKHLLPGQLLLLLCLVHL